MKIGYGECVSRLNTFRYFIGS